MIKSLRWRLQIWHAAILGVAIALFGTAFYLQLHRATFSEIDLELLSGARVLEGTLRTLPPFGNDRPQFPRPRLEDRPMNGRPDGRPDGARGPGGRPPGGVGPGGRPGDNRQGPPRNPGARPERPESRPESRPEGPGAAGRGPFPPEQVLQTLLQLPQFPMRGPRDTPSYFAVFDSQGELIRAEPSAVRPQWSAPQRAIEYRVVDGNREVMLRGPRDTLIIVGRDIRQHVDRLTSWLMQLIVTGFSVLALGLVGGWWLSGKTIRPIQQISDTAGKINATNLSERIETAGMDDEVRALASILNSMLGRLDDSFQQQSQFTADASHELRTPLAVLMSHCELALNRPRSAEEYKQTISTCQKAGARMKTLVEDLLTLARADTGKLELECTSLDLQSLANDAVAMLATLAAERDIEIACEGSSAVCQADARRVAQVIANLLSNAIHYNRAGGSVIIRTRIESSFAILEICDSGCGIPSEATPRLFDRFYRVDEARSRQSGGSGLGLAICKSIIDAHGGSIAVESEPQVGSTFTVRFPISQPAATASPTPP